MALIAAICAIAMTSCNNNDDPGSSTFMDIVTFVSSSETNATFRYQQSNNTPELTLIATNTGITGDNAPTAGERVMIMFGTYNDELPTAATTEIELLGMARIGNSSIQSTNNIDTIAWRDHGVALTALWQVGNYVNIQTRIPAVNSNNITYTLMLDEASLNTDTPTAYLYSNLDFTTEPNYAYDYYASINISAVWPNLINKLRIVTNNRLGAQNEFTLTR